MFKLPLQTPFDHFQFAVALGPILRSWLFKVVRILLLFALVACLALILYTNVMLGFTTTTDLSSVLLAAPAYSGLFLILFCVYLVLLMMRWYFNYYYFYGLDTRVDNPRDTKSGTVFEVARIALLFPHDITRGFLESPFGSTALYRAGLSHKVMHEFLTSQRNPITADTLTAAPGQITLPVLATLLLDFDRSFAEWLRAAGVTPEVFNGAVTWTYQEHLKRKRTERWWGKDALSSRAGIGREFSYGVAYTLNDFTQPIETGAIYADIELAPDFSRAYISQIETLLARNRNANVLLMGEPGVGKMDILVAISKRMERGIALGAIANKHLVLLDNDRLLAMAGNKALFEQTFLKLLREARRAGNIVLVVKDLPDFLRSANEYGVDISSLIDQFISAPDLQLIATTDPGSYHKSIETDNSLLRRFELVQIESPAHTVVIDLIETLVAKYERHLKLRFTYPAVVALVEAADRYIVSGVMPDKAVQLLDEVVTEAQSNGVSDITTSVVESYVAQKTGVPIGPIESEERDTLLNLEEVLHERIVGQEAAITAISNVMRRSRAGIQAKDRPIGSFLFLGPTGVGKTESAKTLAATFFGSDEAMHRLDMSEFSGPEALGRLIGTDNEPGVLSSLLKEHPYAVVLLDEFEKGSSEAHDLFLQILDEGIFTDGRGQKINARNSIIIATSNAGSNEIMDWIQAGEDLAHKKDALVDHIISAGLYKPELINRFDEVVIFAPLSQTEQTTIAGAMLTELAERLKDKGYTLTINQELIDTIAAVGYEPEFGARPMRRAIQDIVESAVAQKIIAGELKAGDSITLSAADLARFTK